jgi:rhamnosyltransferase
MRDHTVCAVIITYNPSLEVLSNIAALRSEVDFIVVVDNGSLKKSLDMLRSGRSELDFELIENGRNLGIATALNLGVCEVKSKAYSWAALFDQDSMVEPGFIHAMLKAHEDSPDPSRVGIVCPVYLDRETDIPLPLPRSRKDEIMAAPTSGSLIPASMFDKVGCFSEALFIDYVDIEFCLRSRRAGYSILQSPHAILHHSMGRITRHRWFGCWFMSTNHSAARRYYITRNRLWVLRKFLGDWRWSSKEVRSTIVETIKIALVEQDRLAKMKSIMLGFADALGGRMGKRFDL